MQPGAAVLIPQASVALYLHALVLRQLGGLRGRWRQAFRRMTRGDQTRWKGLGARPPRFAAKSWRASKAVPGPCFKVGVTSQMSSGDKHDKRAVRLGADSTLCVKKVGNFFDFKKQPCRPGQQQQTARCQLDIRAAIAPSIWTCFEVGLGEAQISLTLQLFDIAS